MAANGTLVDKPTAFEFVHACLLRCMNQEALARLGAGETQADVARTYNVEATTIGRLQPSCNHFAPRMAGLLPQTCATMNEVVTVPGLRR